MSETILFEKTVTLKDGTLVNIRERTQDGGTIFISFLQYLMSKIAENGDLDYPKVATEADPSYFVSFEINGSLF